MILESIHSIHHVYQIDLVTNELFVFFIFPICFKKVMEHHYSMVEQLFHQNHQSSYLVIHFYQIEHINLWFIWKIVEMHHFKQLVIYLSTSLILNLK
jgi:hypothetical protein